MQQGFYNLTSSMITQSRNLDVVSNNISNVSTPGYKKDTMIATTFKEEMLSRTGNTDRSKSTDLNTTSKILTAKETVTDYSQGAFEETENPLNVALSKNGFFEIQTQNGSIYTRNGGFITDDQGYLSLPGAGRVMGTSGQIQLESDNVRIDSAGGIYDTYGSFVDTIKVVDFENYDQLNKNQDGHIRTGAQPVVKDGGIVQKALERSNVSMMKEMTTMMTSQRAIQSASQILKMYDQMMAKSTTEIGRV
ncbi:flagellar hook-basal body protein [Proteocatella sphenisci]|uniref:flagellar hook-basal body protein n=1 Tax=Proteocatella sphenisci TaxID=181070 RepID=UPI00048DE30D|nr:flagellar hook-basal body protein [Proteocatella sphenisci]